MSSWFPSGYSYVNVLCQFLGSNLAPKGHFTTPKNLTKNLTEIEGSNCLQGKIWVKKHEKYDVIEY